MKAVVDGVVADFGRRDGHMQVKKPESSISQSAEKVRGLDESGMIWRDNLAVWSMRTPPIV